MEGAGFILELKGRGEKERKIVDPLVIWMTALGKTQLIPLTECTSFSAKTDTELWWLQRNSYSPRSRWYSLSSEDQVLVSGHPKDHDHLWVTH